LLFKTSLVLAMVQMVAAAYVWATPIVYTKYDEFMAALPGPASVLDFEKLSQMEQVGPGDTLDGITFTYNPFDLGFFGMEKLGVGHVEPFNFGGGVLGKQASSASLNPFNRFETFSISTEPVNALGMYFISHDALEYNGFKVGGQEYTINPDHATLRFIPIPVRAYFLGIIDDQSTFTEATVLPLFPRSVDDYFIDDIITAKTFVPDPGGQVPEPSTMVLFGAGLLGLAGLRRKA
jgi:hypothetical protein